MNNKENRIRILYIQKTGRGGSVISLYELLRELDTDIYEPFVLFQEKNYHYNQFQKLGIKLYHIDRKSNSEFNPKQTNRDIAKALNHYSNFLSTGYREAKQIYLTLKNELPHISKIYSIIKNEKINVVHHNSNFFKNRLSVLVAKFLNIPQIGHMRMFHSLTLIDQYLVRHINFFIYISKAIEDWYLKQGIHQKKGSVIYNPFKIINSRSKVNNSTIRKELGISNEDFLICNISRIDWWKGHKYFIDAVDQVLKFNRNVKALIVGSVDPTNKCQKYYQNLLKQVEKLNLSNHIFFTGYRNDIYDIMQASDVIIHSASEPEPFGRVIVEGMLAGRPVIATDAGGVKDIIDDQVSGLLVPPKNEDAMAKAIQFIMQNPEGSQQIAKNGRRIAKSRFSAYEHVNKVQNLYQRVLAI